MKTEHNTLALTNHATELARLNELTAGLVMNARDNGASWADIGAALGTSKQAAQQKYAPIAAPREVLAQITRGKKVIGQLDDKEASRKLASKEPAKVSTKVAAPAPALKGKMKNPQGQTVDYATNGTSEFREPRPIWKLPNAGTIDGVAQPGTGRGPHSCPECKSSNHKYKPDTVAAYFLCQPTRYDPQDIANHISNYVARFTRA